jgi:Tfp pilus assembly protein PilO
MIKIDDRYKSMIVSGAAIAALYTAAVLLVYMPMHRHLVSLKKEYSQIDAEIAKIKEMAGTDKTFDEVITILKKKLDSISTRFPAKEEGMLKAISEKAAAMGVRLDTLNPGKKRVVESLFNTPVKITGCTVQEIEITMKFDTSFAKLTEFLAAIKDDFPYYLKRVSINIVKVSDGPPPQLDVELRVRSYLVTPT